MRSNSRSGNWPCAISIRASGINSASCRAIFSMLLTSLCRKNTCPPRLISRRQASLTCASTHSVIKVLIAWRLGGGLAIMEISLNPAIAIFKVLGIGVAVNVKKSSSLRIFLKCSFCRTPKRCSSSITTKPNSLNFSSLDNKVCVPITISTLPSASSSPICFNCLGVTKRDMTSTRKGQSAKRSLKFW